jgi:hypothetical protein
VGDKDNITEADLDNGLETSSDVIYDCVDQWQSIIHILRQQFQKYVSSIWSVLIHNCPFSEHDCISDNLPTAVCIGILRV